MAGTQNKEVQIEALADAAHIENETKFEDGVVLKSPLDDLGLWATVKRFWKVKSRVSI
jgi:hypothetical protein